MAAAEAELRADPNVTFLPIGSTAGRIIAPLVASVRRGATPLNRGARTVPPWNASAERTMAISSEAL